MELTAETLDQILDEISGFEVQLVEDPTLPQYGTRYLQKCISDCRNFTNRVQYYLQICKKEEKVTRRELMIADADFDIKFKQLLSEDLTVRRESSYGDRQARATSLLKDEVENVSKLKTRLQDLEETIKILKMKYGDLKAMNSDIKFQRQLIKDNVTDGGDGSNTGRTYGSGMGPKADQKPINPSDLFDDNKRPEDLPKPKDEAHARQIANFFNNKIDASVPKSEFQTPNVSTEPEETNDDKRVTGGVDYNELLS